MKKIFTVLLVMVMMFSMAVPVFADENTITETVDLTARGDAMDLEALPEGNQLIEGTKWATGIYGATKVTEGTFQGQTMYSMTGWDSAYGSPYLDLYPTLKKMLGEEDELTVYIVFDIRVLNIKALEGESHGFGVKIRAGGLTAASTEQEVFKENYMGDVFTHTGASGISLTLLTKGKESISEDWQRFELLAAFTEEDLSDEYWTQLNLCFDNLATFAEVGAVQVKNTAVFNVDDYEPMSENQGDAVIGGLDDEEEDEPVTTPVDGTPAPVTIHKPIGFNKYQVTFKEAVDTEVEGGLVDTDTNGGTNGGTNNSSTFVIIIVAAAAIVVLGAVIGIVISKKKKSAVKEDKE